MIEDIKNKGEPDGLFPINKFLTNIAHVYRGISHLRFHHARFTESGSGGRIIEMYHYKYEADKYLKNNPGAIIREVEKGDINTWIDGKRRRHHHRNTFMDNVEVP